MEAGAQGTDLSGVGHRHACAFFRTPAEELAVLVPFSKEGLDRGDRLWYMVDPARGAALLARLDANGIDTAALRRTGQLGVSTWAEAHLRGGRFDLHAMLELLDATMADNRARGFAGTRLWSNQEWALEDVPGVVDVVEYEVRYDDVAERHDDLTVCVFDPTRFGGETVVDMLRVHPQVIIDGAWRDSPFYVPPDQPLSALRSGHGTAGAAGAATPSGAEAPGTAAAEPARLTATEREIARLVAAGLTDEEVAARPAPARGAVSAQVAALLDRLGFERRTQLAAWAMARGLHRADREHE
jgi:DNA-binding CsgD family transcriptional regulator